MPAIKPEIPNDINELKRSWWDLRHKLQESRQTCNELRLQLIQYEKVSYLADGLIMELNTKRPEPELLDNIKNRLHRELLSVSVNKVQFNGVRRQREAVKGEKCS